MSRKPVLGLIGGVGSGKTALAGQFERLGAAVLSGDEVGHQVLRREDVKQKLRRRWGQELFGPDGEVDRRKLADRVFATNPGGRDDLQYLTGVVHPLIGAELRGRLETLQQDPTVRLIVLDAALLLEAGWQNMVDRILYVDAPRAVREQRARDSRGWNAEQFQAREIAQLSLNVKRQHADYVVDNSGSLEQTLPQIERIYFALTEHPPT